MNMASTNLLALSEKLVVAADHERWEEVSQLQVMIHEAVVARDALKIYARNTLEQVQTAVNTARDAAIQRRDQIGALVSVLSR